jgi:hypothetical protein
MVSLCEHPCFVASNGRAIQGFGRRKAVVFLLRYFCVFLEVLRRTARNMRKDSTCPFEIRTKHAPDRSQERCLFANPLGRMTVFIYGF